MRSSGGQRGFTSIKMSENYYRRESVPFLDQREPRWRNCEQIVMNYEEHRELAGSNADLRYGTARTYWC